MHQGVCVAFLYRRVINEGKPPSEQPKQDQAKPRLILERPRPPMQQAAAPASSAASAQEPDSSRVTAAKTKLQERLAANAEVHELPARPVNTVEQTW